MKFVNQWMFREENRLNWARMINEVLRYLAVMLNGNLDSTNFTSTGLAGKYCKSKAYNNFLLLNDVFGRYYSPGTMSVTKLFLSIGEVADANITIEVYKNDVATGQIATLSSGETSEMTVLGTAISFIEDDKVSLKITACGTDTDPGSDLDVDIYYTM